MNGEETIVNQPQSSESTDYSSFLGTEPVSIESTSEQNPEPTEVVTEDEPVLEAEGAVEEEVQEEAESAEQASVDEWFSSLTPEEHAYYAKRYPTLYNAYQAADQPADLKAAFKDRVNQDRTWAAKRQEQQTAKVEEPTLETEQEAVQADPTQQREQYQQFVDSLIETNIDQKAVEQFGVQFLESIGVDIKNAADPEVKALIDNAPKVGRTLMRGATDLVTTILPSVIDRAIEARYPGMTQMYERTLMQQSWESVRSKQVDKGDGTVDSPFANLPAFGTKEFQSELKKAAAEYAGSVEEFDAMVFRDPKSGRPLSPVQNAQKKYEILAKVIAGQKQTVDPKQLVEKAVSTGKRIATEQQNKLAQGKALGAGRSSRTLDSGKDVSPLRRGFEIYRERDQNLF